MRSFSEEANAVQPTTQTAGNLSVVIMPILCGFRFRVFSGLTNNVSQNTNHQHEFINLPVVVWQAQQQISHL